MPLKPSNPKSGKKSKSRLGGYASFSKRFLRDLEDIVTGIPTGVAVTARAVDTALPASPIPGVDEGHRQSYKPIAAIGRNMLEQTKEDIRHPLRNPASSLLTALGLLSLGTGTAVRGAAGLSAASKGAGIRGAAKAAARPKPATRKLKTIQKGSPVVGPRYKMGGRWIEQSPGRTGRRELEMLDNPNPIIRGMRKVTLDPIYERSAKKASQVAKSPKFNKDAKILKHGSAEYRKVTEGAKTPAGILKKARAAGYSGIQRGDRTVPVNKAALAPKQSKKGGYARFVERRTLDQRKRYSTQLKDAMNDAPEKVTPGSTARDLYTMPADLMRIGMYLRPRYYAQNVGGTASLLAHQGVGIGDIKAVRGIAKSDPELWKMMKGAMGETGTSSISMGGSGRGRVGRASDYLAHKANKPEANMRPVALWKAAKDFGITDPAELKRILSKPDSNQAQLLMQQANEAVIDYSRVGGSSAFGRGEKKFVRSGVPIFYPMTKGFSRYAGRFPTQHPVQTAGLAQLGQMGKEAQVAGLGGDPQPWFPYITPVGKDRTMNLQNIFNFSPGADITRQTLQMAPGAERHPTLNLLQQFGPGGELIHGAITGRQLATGFEYDEDALDKYGNLGAAFGDTARGVLPFSDLIAPRTSAAYGTPDISERLAIWAAGPGFIQRKTNFKKARQKKRVSSR